MVTATPIASHPLLQDFPIKEWIVLLLLASFAALLSLLHPHHGSLWDLTIRYSTAVLGITALGMLTVFYVREFDLTIGSTFAISLTTLPLLAASLSPWATLGLLLAIIGAIGYVNGLLVATLRASLVTTFTLMFLWRGAVYLLNDGTPMTLGEDQNSAFWEALGWGEIWNIPYSILLFLVFVAILEVVFRHSSVGRNLVAIGLDPVRATFCQIKQRRYKVGAFVFSALMAFLASLIYYARLKTVNPQAGFELPFDALAVVILSNAGIQQSKPSPFRVMIVTILLVIIGRHLEIFGLQPKVAYVMTGGLIVIALLVRRFLESSPN